jgi:hypothetical protein
MKTFSADNIKYVLLVYQIYCLTSNVLVLREFLDCSS